MIRCLTSGGLGDALMSIAKLHSEKLPFTFDDNVFVTHYELPKQLLKSIDELYSSQNISHEVVTSDSPNWIADNIGEYDYYLGTSWSKHNVNSDSWEINPFPNLKFNKVKEYDLVISPFAARDMHRGITNTNLDLNAYKTIAFVGWCPQDYNVPSEKTISNFLNKTSISQAIDIVASAQTFVGNPGFFMFLACMLKKQVLSTKYNSIKDYYIHPKWNIKWLN